MNTLLLALQMVFEPVENDGLEAMIELAPHRCHSAVGHNPGHTFLLIYFRLTTQVSQLCRESDNNISGRWRRRRTGRGSCSLANVRGAMAPKPNLGREPPKEVTGRVI